jgi:hypothetical protein
MPTMKMLQEGVGRRSEVQLRVARVGRSSAG